MGGRKKLKVQGVFGECVDRQVSYVKIQSILETWVNTRIKISTLLRTEITFLHKVSLLG